MFMIPVPISRNFHILNNNRSNRTNKQTIMIAISEDEETTIDNIGDSNINFTRGNRIFSVTMKDIYCYGEVDFNDEDILNKINSFKFLNHLDAKGVNIPAGYNYNTNTCDSTSRRLKWSETWSPAELAKFAHGCLNKPKRILLFNQIVKC